MTLNLIIRGRHSRSICHLYSFYFFANCDKGKTTDLKQLDETTRSHIYLLTNKHAKVCITKKCGMLEIYFNASGSLAVTLFVKILPELQLNVKDKMAIKHWHIHNVSFYYIILLSSIEWFDKLGLPYNLSVCGGNRLRALEIFWPCTLSFVS